MWKSVISPKFFHTDALQHISNSSTVLWFESSREEIYKIFTPDLNPKNWGLILAKLVTNFHHQLYYPDDVEVIIKIKKIGNKSFTTYEEIYQKDTLCASCEATFVHFDHKLQTSVSIPEEIRIILTENMD
jgi:acyl-CoA thioester hydrolase